MNAQLLADEMWRVVYSIPMIISILSGLVSVCFFRSDAHGDVVQDMVKIEEELEKASSEEVEIEQSVIH